MGKRTPIWVISFFLLASGMALGLQSDTSNSSQMQREEPPAWTSLPDAPSSVQPPTQPETFHAAFNEVRSPFTRGAVGVSERLVRGRGVHFAPGMQPNFTVLDRTVVSQNEPSTFLDKYVYPSLLKRNLRYEPSTSTNFLGRATDAASRIFISRDDSGKGTLNTSYFLGLLTSVAVHTAYRPYWARSPSSTLNNFGSTMGSNAGINLFREFAPGIRGMVKAHTPKFVTRIQDGITHDQLPRNVVE